MSATVPLTETTTPTLGTQAVVYATFFRRYCAMLIDSFGIGIVGIVITARLADHVVAGADGTLVAGVVTFMLWLAYYVLGNGRGATLGKRLLKLRVVDAEGQPPGICRGLVRILPSLGACLLVSGLVGVLVVSGEPWASLFGSSGGNLLLLLPLIIDGLWMLWDPHRQTLHDKLAGTYVLAAGSAR
jgi:uncharacterized RDD family membrane protein YckC